ncbi:MAG TPA: sulfurtransferase TusA family protein [bacterium]
MIQQTLTVDVQDMLCAQALRVVARAMRGLPPGGELDIRYNAPDVRTDLGVWARECGHNVVSDNGDALRLMRGRRA